MTIKKLGLDRPLLARQGENFSVGDLVETGAEGKAQAMLQDSTVMNLSRGTSVRVLHYSVDPVSERRTGILKVLAGKVRFITTPQRESRLSLETPIAAVASAGSADFVAEVTAERTTVAVLSGAVTVKNSVPLYVGNVSLAANQFATVEPKKPPSYAAPLPEPLRRLYIKDARNF